MKYVPMLLPVFVVLLVSGCTIPGTGIEIPFIPDILGGSSTGTSDVLIIKQMNAYPDKIREDQTIRLDAYIQNVGEKEIVSGSDGSIDVSLYDYCIGVFETPNIVCNGKPASGTECKIDRIYPKETVQVYWNLKPKQPINLETPCTLKISVTYPYKTSSLSTINFINADEQKRQIEDGSYKTKASQQTVGEGPVKPYIKALEPQPIQSEASGGGTTPITFEIKDTGSGFVVQERRDAKTAYILEITSVTYTNGNEEIKCAFPGVPDGKKETISGGGKQITLMQERSSIISCDLTKPAVAKERVDNIVLGIRYEYEIRKEKKVTITPKPK